MTTGEHAHCYCNEDTGGRIVCCVCGAPLKDIYDKPELVMMWEKMWHDEKKEERKVTKDVEQNPRLF